MSVLVVVEHDRGTLADASLEAFAFARSIAEQLGEPVEALLIGDDEDDVRAIVRHAVPPSRRPGRRRGGRPLRSECKDSDSSAGLPVRVGGCRRCGRGGLPEP